MNVESGNSQGFSSSVDEGGADAVPQNPPQEVETPTPPSQISGTLLTCQPEINEQREILCSTGGGENLPKEGESIKAFVVTGSEQQKVEIPSRKTVEAGNYMLRIPDATTDDYGIILQIGSRSFAAWVSNSLSRFSLVKNGGFEDYNISDAEQFRFIPSESSPDWKAIKGEGVCSDQSRFLEIQFGESPIVGQKSIEGRNHLELDSACSDNTGQSNLVFQDLTLIPGHSYQFSFQILRRSLDTTSYKVRFSFGDFIASLDSVDGLDWVPFKIILQANAVNTRISFEELGIENGVGPLLDAVQVVDLGVLAK